ncbi:glycosyltransferase family 2 protein [Gonapodya prolifera JEL478]|uniref:Chitin synthase n=1 Tax=Gonapodya prolifera (strain JEL478) TaxID=1344416 RepID=A0A139AD70_GONPJ|nr:glycosyltransferase family 2 protein [Gonapodya prolifera JEL478]|eukprot:KXS14698.1 glycosyltransferase family 2 protein [Gonapodya prolifera JEL478]
MAGRYSAVPTSGPSGQPPPGGRYSQNSYAPGGQPRQDLPDEDDQAPMMAQAGGKGGQGQRVAVPPPRGGSNVPPPDYSGNNGGGGRVRFDPNQQPPPRQGSFAGNGPSRMAGMSRDQQPGFKRSKTKKSFALTPKGNLQVDIKVPPKLIEGSSLSGWETEYLRYTAPACDPDEFPRQGFTLRPKEHSTPRQIELAICCTMYNESPDLFAKSWTGIVQNLTYLMGKTRSPTWGPDSWKKIAIVVVSDGRANCNKQTLALLGLLGLYQEGIVVGTVPNKFPSNDGSNDEAKVTAHIFEYTTQVMVDEDMRIQNTIPIQTIFVLKEQNAKKINSHRWFFHAICPILQPRVTVLIDIGTRPLDKAIYHLWKVFDRHPNVGGACGEIRAELGPWWKNVWNPLVAAQNFEYKISNILDKPLESAFGYISVLPGAFSAYRYAALQANTRDKQGNVAGPLQAYFKGEALHSGKLQGNTFINNMYLAEDRILCFELVSKTDESWVLRYERASAAETDVPDAIPELIKQRRRWLNGSTFAALYAIWNWANIFRSSHSPFRKTLFMLETGYNILVQLFAWFSLANFYLTFFFVIEQNKCGTGTDAEMKLCDTQGALGRGGYYVAEPLKAIYLMLICVQFILSMGNRPDGAKTIGRVCTVLWSLIMVLLIYMIFFGVAQSIITVKTEIASGATNIGLALLTNSQFRNIVISMGSTFGLWFLMSVLFLDPWHMFNSFFQYMLLMPFYVNMMQIYAYCNTHDISWGTKGADKDDHGLGSAKKQEGGKAQEVTLEVPDENKKEEANKSYDKFYADMVRPAEPTPDEKAKKAASVAKEKAEDAKKRFRTLLVLFWMITNLLLIIPLTSVSVIASGSGGQYLAFLFFSTTFFALVRAIGSMSYLITQQLFDHKEDPDEADVGNLVAQRPRFGKGAGGRDTDVEAGKRLMS